MKFDGNKNKEMPNSQRNYAKLKERIGDRSKRE